MPRRRCPAPSTSRARRHPGRPRPAAIDAWLHAPGSLTAHLSACCTRFSVSVLRQGKTRPWPDEARALSLRPGQAVYGREVVLHCDGNPMVLARSVLSARASRLTWKGVRGLGSRPLADLLFGGTAVSRSPLEAMRFLPGQPRTRWARRLWQQTTGRAWGTRSVWARRSCFTLRGMPMLVMECFEPTVAQLRHGGLGAPVRRRSPGGPAP